MKLGLDRSACVVTGGSSGIGFACVRELLAEGASVLAVGRSQERLETARSELGDSPGVLEVLAVDVTAADAPERILRTAEARFDRVDGLVNCAGSSRLLSLEDSAPRLWRQQWELDVMAPKRLMDVLVPAMVARGAGTVVNVCSTAGRRPSATDAAYAVAKRGELALTEVYAQRCGADGVRILAVAPGPTETSLWMAPGGRLDELVDTGGEGREQVRHGVEAKLPLGRLADADEVAAVILAALAGLGATGATLAVDGGHVPETFP